MYIYIYISQRGSPKIALLDGLLMVFPYVLSKPNNPIPILPDAYETPAEWSQICVNLLLNYSLYSLYLGCIQRSKCVNNPSFLYGISPLVGLDMDCGLDVLPSAGA